MRADDWLCGRTPETAVFAKFEQRASNAAISALTGSYPRHEATAILHSVYALALFYRDQVVLLHERFRLSRPLSTDMEAIDTVLGAIMPPSF
jgi:hypothetical protein